MATETTCKYCGGLVDHRSPVIKRHGIISIRACIHCGHHQRCRENIVSDQNEKYVRFVDKLLASPKTEPKDVMKCKYLRDVLVAYGYAPESSLADFRYLQKKYDTEI